MISIGMKAPDFSAETTMGKIRMSDFKGHWVVLFSHPGDFTPVCTTEFIEFSKMSHKFKSINTQLLGLSIDSTPSHLAWLYAIKMSSDITVPFPIIADQMGEIAEKYEMISPYINKKTTVRTVFIIDDFGIIRAIMTYPPTTGRNIAEILRTVEALQTADSTGTVTPANWQKNQATMLPAPDTYNELLKREADIENNNCDDWYLCYNEE